VITLLASHSALEQEIQSAAQTFATRESFLRAATIQVTPAGEVMVVLRRGQR
jgi:hypothetical protein